MRNQCDPIILHSLVHPSIVEPRFQLSWFVVREYCCPRNGQAHFTSIHAVTVLGIIHKSETVRLALEVSRHVDPSLARILISTGIALHGPFGDLIRRLWLFHIYRKCELEHLLM